MTWCLIWFLLCNSVMGGIAEILQAVYPLMGHVGSVNPTYVQSVQRVFREH